MNLVGLGLRPEHLTEEARKVLSLSDKIYLDTYTNIVPEEWIASWESMVGKSFLRADRSTLEDGMKAIISEAKVSNVSVAVVGDPLTATTHISLYTEALKEGIDVRYVPGLSIHTVAMSLSGFEHYRFGRTVTVPYLWRQSPSFYERIASNRSLGLHTLLLLDLHPEPLTIRTALEALLYWEKELKRGVIDLSELVVGIARACWDDCFRFVGTVEELMEISFPPPPHVLIIPGDLHPIEEETLYVLRRHSHGKCKGTG